MTETDSDSNELRRAAMERLRNKHDAFAGQERNVHEMQVFQEELLLQQEALLESTERLERSLERSRLLFEDAPVPYLILDQAGRTLQMNHAARDTLGAIKPIKQGRGRLLITLIDDSSRAVFLSALKHVFLDDAVKTVEVLLGGGRAIWELKMRVRAELSDSQRVCLVSATDVTYVRVAERELRAAQVEAERANHLKERFLANMSHEVRTPLTLILGYLQVLANDDLGAEAARRIDIIYRAGRNLLGVLNDVVDFAKIEADQLSIDVKSFDAVDTIETAIALFEHAARDAAITLKLQVDADAPPPARLDGDELRINQVLVNILSNAFKYTPNSGAITVTIAYRQRNLVVSVADTGPGVPTELLEHIFQPFRQVDNADDREHGGAGLGLAISRRVMDLMGGSLLARNLKDGGACFTLQLPLPESAQVAQVGPQKHALSDHSWVVPYADATPGDVEVLLVDDDENIRDLVGLYIDDAGYEYESASDGFAALDLLQQKNYAIVLLDVQMPGLDGYETIRRARQEFPERDVFVVALTARAMKQDQIDLTDAGFDAYIAKPVDFDALLDLIAARVGRSAAPESF